MKTTGFREIIKTYKVYDATVVLTSASHIPENATVEIEHSDDYFTVTVYIQHGSVSSFKQREAICQES